MFGIDRKSALEIRVHRHLHSGRNNTQMLKHLIQRDLIVRAAQRPCETRARRVLSCHHLQHEQDPVFTVALRCQIAAAWRLLAKNRGVKRPSG